MRAAVNEPQLGFVKGGCLFRLDNGLEWDRVVWTSGVPLRVRDGRGSWRLEVVVGFEVVLLETILSHVPFRVSCS